MEKNTYFASPLRSSADEIIREYELVGSHKFFTEVFGAMTGIGAIIDKNRQIVYANDEFLVFLGIDSLEPILGKRPGEIISCQHTSDGTSGCGTSLACAYCGVVNTILESQRTGRKVMKETHISTISSNKHKSWDMNTICTPIGFNGDLLYVLILQDISEVKKKVALERIFYHDLLNSVGGLYGLLTVLKEETNPEQTRELINLSEEASRNIIDEILIQRQLRYADSGELNVYIEQVNTLQLIDSAIGKIGFHEAVQKQMIVKDENSANIEIATDKTLLQRVLINLLKNALEAAETNGYVQTGVMQEGDEVIFWVKNDQVMPHIIQAQLFQRTFSTKGDGRGLGTYSIRLLTENYLKGKVTFVSNETDGTIFYIRVKIKFPSE